MNPLYSMCALHRRFGLLHEYREIARRIVAIVLLVYLGASFAAALGGLPILAPGDGAPMVAWSSPLVMPQEWQWRGSVLAMDPMFRSALNERRIDWLDLSDWMLP